MAAVPWVVPFDAPGQPGREVLGGKGWGLALIHRLGLPVPPGFTVTTAACRGYRDAGGRVPDEAWRAVRAAVGRLEQATGRRFGGSPPLLVSVRSGAPVSMPGMLDTVLDVGAAGRGDPADQLRRAMDAVFASWNSPRARVYRTTHGIGDEPGTAVTVQAMVYGDRDERSGSGVYLTRDPVTGAPEPAGEWLRGGNGEAVVSGRHTPRPIGALAEHLPDAYAELVAAGTALERELRRVVEIEYTVQAGALYLLQVRPATGTPTATVRWAVDLVRDGVTDVAGALAQVPADRLAQLGRTGLDEAARQGAVRLAHGTAATSGVAAGTVVTEPDEAAERAEAGESVVLARPTTSPHDIHGFLAAAAVLTERGGSTSHAAVVSRQLGLPCVVGCGDGAVARLAGRTVTVDADRGEVLAGRLPVSRDEAARTAEFAVLSRWRDEMAEGKG